MEAEVVLLLHEEDKIRSENKVRTSYVLIVRNERFFNLLGITGGSVKSRRTKIIGGNTFARKRKI